MILALQQQIRVSLADAIRRTYGVADVPPFAIEMPPNRALGDLAVPVAFQLARTLRKAPRAIAQELASAIGPIVGVARIDAAPNGFLNLFLDRRTFLLTRITPETVTEQVVEALQPERTQKTIVEHTAINPNKAAHIGH